MKNMFLLVLFCISILSCQKIILDEPEGFANIEEGKIYKAVSPEGVILKIRIVENAPSKDVEFWGDALSYQLKKEGYVSSSDGVYFTGAEHGGYYHEWALAYGTDTFKYLTAIIPYEKKIIIAEAAGEYIVFADYRDSIIECLKTVKLEKGI